MPQRLHERVTRGSDDGFSLVEAIVALAIATAIFTALAFALIGGAKAGLLSQQNQQAGDILNQAVEDARALSYGALSMRSTDLDTGEPARSPTISSCLCYNPFDDSTAEDTSTAAIELEALAPRDDNGGLSPHATTVSQNGRAFTVRQYVTIPNDAAGAVYKRLTVVVTWEGLGKERKRIYSTLVADTKRGLPLPDFKYNAVDSLAQCRNPGSNLSYAFTLRNNGARDAWSLSPTTGTPIWTYFEDTDANGAFDILVDQPLPLTGSVPTTGPIEPTTSREFFAVTTLQTEADRPAPYTLTTVFRATSVAQPDYWQELTGTATVQTEPCGSVATSPAPSPSASTAPAAPTQPAPSCASLTGGVTTSAPLGTMVRYYPLNPSQPSNTVASTGMPVKRDDGTGLGSIDLYNYATDLHSAAGRRLQTGTASSTAAAQVASWNYVMPAASKIEGEGEVTFWARPSDGSLSAQPSFTVYLDVLKNNGTVDVNLGTISYTTPSTGWGCSGYRPVSLAIVNNTGSPVTVQSSRVLRLRVVVTSADPVDLAYGTSSYPMTMTLPYSNGLG